MNNFKKNIWTILLSFLVIIFLWISDYPPMIDLPQHAAQVSTFISLINQTSSWSEIVEINYLTPYWIGYGPWIALCLIFDVITAFKILVSSLFVLYVLSIRSVFRKINAPLELSILAIPLFFGFSYQWGFLTFIAAIPIGMLLLNFSTQSIKKQISLKFITIFTTLGFILFLSHILVFVFFCLITFIYRVLSIAREKALVKKSIISLSVSYLFFSLILIGYLKSNDPLSGLYSYGDNFYIYSSGENRFLELFILPWSGSLVKELNALIFSACMILTPFILRYKLSKDNRKYIPFAISIVLWFSLPHFISNTFFIYQRYSIFIFIFYFMIFEKHDHTGISKSFNKNIFIVALAFLITYNPLVNIWFFSKETKSFERLISNLPENKRALSLIFDTYGLTIRNPAVYVHFPLWYQAQKNGFVDFNFAWFNPQIIRFKPSKAPEVKPSFEWQPQNHVFIEHCDIYDLIILRTTTNDAPPKITLSNCSFSMKANSQTWYAYERD